MFPSIRAAGLSGICLRKMNLRSNPNLSECSLLDFSSNDYPSIAEHSPGSRQEWLVPHLSPGPPRGERDTLFAAGVLALGWFVLGLKLGWSVEQEVDLPLEETVPAPSRSTT